MKWKKRHTLGCIVLLLLAAAGIGLRTLHRRAIIADIISDEAAWDAIDAASWDGCDEAAWDAIDAASWDGCGAAACGEADCDGSDEAARDSLGDADWAGQEAAGQETE